MKSFSPQLLDFLLTHKVFNRADLFLIELSNGQIITATSAQQDINFGFQGTSPVIEQIYYSTLFGAWERGSVTSEASYAPKSNTMDLTVLAGSSILYPGTSVPLTQVVLAGLFDAAQVTVFTIYWPIGAKPAYGIEMGYETKFAGKISKVTDAGRDKITFEVADMLYMLSIEVPLNVIQSSCRHVLFDSNCALLESNFAYPNSLASGSTQMLLNLALGLSSASFFVAGMSFSQGRIKFTTGQNAGSWAYIKQQKSNTQVLLNAPLPFPVSTGDQCIVYPGCDLTLATCQNVYSNLINNGSTPFVPNPEVSL